MKQRNKETSGAEDLFFLPGAGGNVDLWRPIAEGLSPSGRRVFFSWPGFSGSPADPSMRGLDDLVGLVARRIEDPAVLFAQSMGGVIALRVALERPKSVKALVLSVTSGGIDVASLGGVDWRPEFARKNPETPRWFLDARDDVTRQLPTLDIPTLLLWGDADPISPVAVGLRLEELLPSAELVVVPRGTHDLVFERSGEVLPLIERFLESRVVSA